MVEGGARGRRIATPARAGERLSPAGRERRRLWIVLGGAIVMAVAGALAGAGARPDDLAYPIVRGPRLRVSPAAAVKPVSLYREGPSGHERV